MMNDDHYHKLLFLGYHIHEIGQELDSVLGRIISSGNSTLLLGRISGNGKARKKAQKQATR
jgi:hypothetical protein